MKTFHFFLAAFLVAAQVACSAASPTIVNVLPLPGTVSSLTQITVTFSVLITNIIGTDLLLNGQPADTVSGAGAVYTFALAGQPAYGAVQITWDPSHDISDLNVPSSRFDETAPGSTWQYNLVDQTPPALAGLAPAAGVGVRTLTQIEVIFNEPVAGVEAGDLTINGVPASGLSALASGKYRFIFPQPANGTVQVAWATGHGIRDFAAPANNFAGGSWTYTLDPNLGLPRIRINEFTTSNINTNRLKDEDADLSDWIELWNYGPAAINLAGYSLTDDKDDPGKWVFPATNIAAGQFLVVFASGKDRKTLTAATNRFHTSFKLSVFGNYLALFNAELPRQAITEFAPKYPEQRNDYSYGYDNADTLKYFASPTPGASNGTSAITSFAPPVHFNVDRGLFDSPFSLALNDALTDATIRYTLDGSEPTATNGLIYTSPIIISNTTVVRATAFRANTLPSVTVTHTYIFLDGVLRQPNNPYGFPTGATVFTGYPSDYEMDPEIVTNAIYGPQMKSALKALPVVSLVTSVDDMFGPVNGIYTHPEPADAQRYLWERACSVELILTNGETGFQVNCGVRIQGNASRTPQKTPKHPFRLVFKGDYGPGRLEYPVYPDSPVTSFDTLVMRADFNNSWLHWDAGQRIRGTRIRDGWTKDTWRDMGQPGSHTRYFHLYINGVYWGVYDFGERVDATFAANYLGGQPEEYDAIASKPTEAIDGDITAYNTMAAAITGRSQTVLSNYTTALQYLDIDNFIDYMLLNFYGANQDWGNDSNWNAVRHRSPDGRFKYISWDGEQLIVSTTDNRVSNTDVPGGLHTSLVNSAEYRLNFADRAHKHLFNGGALSTNAVIRRWLTRAAQLDLAIIAESARWGDYRRDVAQYQTGPYLFYTRNTNWVPEIDRMITNYFPQRGDIFLQQLRSAGLYPTVAAPVFGQYGGYVPRGFNLSMSATNPVYYTLDGSDPRVFGASAVSPGAQLYTGPITLNNSVVVKARAQFGTTWSALNEATFTADALGSPLRITEIMYNPIGGDAYEFIELQNVSPTVINVGSWAVDGINFGFPPNTILQPGQVIVLASDSSPANWTARYPGVTAFGRFSGKLDNGGEKLAIRDATGKLLWSVDYDDENGWPTTADGQGASLEIIDAFGDPDDPANWRASAAPNGTPGTTTPPPSQGAVVINEVMAENGLVVNNGGFYPDWVELYNPGAQSVDMVGWSLTDDSNPRKFVFPANTTVAAGNYLVVWCDTNSLVPGLRAPFGLGRNGDTVLLYDANTNRVDAVGFGIQLPNYTVGRVAGVWQLNQPTPNAANAAAATANASNLVINEWLANAPPGGDDWVELYNRSATAPVALRGIYLGVSNALQQLNALSFIAPGSYAQLFADENGGANHLDFKLPAAGGTIVLHAETGIELDHVAYGPQAQGVSQGRLPDGTASIASFPATPSPAASNYLLSYNGPILNEVLVINNAAVTNGSGRTADFVELWNPNGTPFDLSGMRLSNDPENASQWTFPPGVSIPGNGYLVVWFDNELPTSTANGPVLNTGQSLDGESGEVWLFNSAGQPVDSVVFGFQIADLPIGLSGGQWTLLSSATPGVANSAPIGLASAVGLRINEWSANPATGNDWFELYNTASQPVSLSGLYLTDNPSLTGLSQFTVAPLSYIDARGFVRCAADADQSQGRNHVNFNLDGEGEVLRIASPALGVIDTVSFGAQTLGVSQGRLPDGSDNIVEFDGSPTPAGSNYRPLPNAVINEVLTRAGDPLEDAIEIYNPSTLGIDLSGWFLSDSASDFKKYRIADQTFLPAGGYRVFYQTQFNAGGPGSFTLDPAGGEQVHLSEADAAGNLSGRRAVARFGAAADGVSFGRYETCHGVDFVAMSQRTFGQDTPASLAEFRTGTGLFNAYPKVGPVVINELMYHPSGAGAIDNTLDEYVELHNLSAAAVTLYDPAHPANTWRLRNGVSFIFPQSVTLPAGGYLVVVGFDPVASPAQLAAFRGLYGVAASVPVVGPYAGKLDNGGEGVELYRPDMPQAGTGYVPYVLVDRVEYGDSAPWPVGGDGDGASLQRGVATEYGNDAANWFAAGPTAGRTNAAQPARAPSIVSQPVSRAVSAGSRVVFGVSVCGSGPLTYQWKFNGGNIANATNASYVITSAQGANTGNFTVFVSNGAGNVLSDPASLVLMDPPVITAQPQGQAVGGGLSATFSVEASGTGPLSYQWRRNGVALPGATSASLTVDELHRSDAGDYSVLVGNPAGSIASAVATLAVLVPPTITLQPQSQVVNTNTTVVFTIAANGTGPVRYQWQFNGANISGATGAMLTLNNVTLANEGDYRVLVTDDITTGVSAVARLTVRVPPVVLVGPRGQTNAVGSTITLSVTASGSVPMGFFWRKGSLPVTNFVLMTTNSTFTISNAQMTDSATWRCIITNSGNVAPGVLSQASILILAPPALTNSPVSQIVEPGANVTFTAGAAGSAPLYYRWQFQGADIANATNTSLSLLNVQLANQGEYQVTVTNLVGSASGTAMLTVGTPIISLRDAEWLGNGSVRLKLSGVPNRNHAIEMSPNLINWTMLGTIFYTNGLMPFEDATISATTNRFYRARLLP